MPSWLPFALATLACPVGMGLIMWFMMRGERGRAMTTDHTLDSMEERLARLEAEKKALEQQIARASEAQVAHPPALTGDGSRHPAERV